MTETLLLVILFVVAVASLPWLVRLVQQRRGRLVSSPNASSKVLSAVAVGPQQRVVSVEVGPELARTTLVLGVTSQSIRCLHSYPSGDQGYPAAAPFSKVMAQAAASASPGALRSESDSAIN